ncbi:uncharacterized protein LOC119977218 [Scyliorhinus canicula]|uniref:uncharacterized protein LOC119977218 n=1 Tax=Scyliorhinus canicula TaxID=7830 RepID=UPI0018F7C246|nr:uncharacterized protein LOC119977218 [Scyliorhinus canicula]
MTSSVQNSTFCTDKEGNKKEVKNNNEQLVGTDGDANANEITSQTYIKEEKEERHNLTAGIVNEHRHTPRNTTVANEALDDSVKQGWASQSAEVGDQSHTSRNLEFSEPDQIGTAELESTEYIQHHEKACSLQCPVREDRKCDTGKIKSVSQIQKEWYPLKRHTYTTEAAAEHQWPKGDVTDENKRMHFMQLLCKDSSPFHSLEKVTKKDVSAEIGVPREDGAVCLPDNVTMTDCCIGPLNFQEFCMDVCDSTHYSHKAPEELIKTISPPEFTSVETIVFHSNSSTSESEKSCPKPQMIVERPLDHVNVSTSHCENKVSTLGPGGELLVAVNKLEAQLNLNTLPDQCRVIEEHNDSSDRQETGEFLSEVTGGQNRKNSFEVREEEEPCDISQQSPTRLPEEKAKTVQHLPDNTREQHLKNLNVEQDQFSHRQVESYGGDSPVSENNSSVLTKQCCKNKMFSLMHTEFGAQRFIEEAEHLGSSFPNTTNNVKFIISGIPNTNHKTDNTVESDKVPCTGTSELSKQEFDSLHDAFEIIEGKKEDTWQSFVSGSSSLVNEAGQMKSISKLTEKGDAEALSTTYTELPKQRLSKQGANTGPGVCLGQYIDECSVEKAEGFLQKESNEIKSSVMIIGEKQLVGISEELQHTESLVVSQTVNPAFTPCTEVGLKVTYQSSDPAFNESSLPRAEILSESSPLPPLGDTQTSNSFSKAVCNSGIPKPILQHPRTVLTDKGEADTNYPSKPEAKLIPKPKYVRPKIITYIRKPLQVKPLAIHEVLGLSPKLSTWTECNSKPCFSKEYKTSACESKPLSVLSVPGSTHDINRPELQRTKIYTTGLMLSGIKPPAQQTFPRILGKPLHSSSDVTSKKATEMLTQGSIPETETLAPGQTGPVQNVASVPEECSSPASYPAVSRLPKTLRPPLGLGAISRLPSAKSRLAFQSQRTSINSTALHIQGQAGQEIAVVTVPSLLKDLALYWVEQKKNTIPIVQRSNLPKPGHSGLRPPGYSRLPAAKLVAFGFVRSSSVSSVSSNQSNDSDHSKAANRSNSGSEEKISLKTGAPANDVSKRAGKIGLQPPGSTATNCWSLLPAPKSTLAGTMKKEAQKDHDIPKPMPLSPKRHVIPASKLHPPGTKYLVVKSKHTGTCLTVYLNEKQQLKSEKRHSEKQGTVFDALTCGRFGDGGIYCLLFNNKICHMFQVSELGLEFPMAHDSCEVALQKSCP